MTLQLPLLTILTMTVSSCYYMVTMIRLYVSEDSEAKSYMRMNMQELMGKMMKLIVSPLLKTYIFGSILQCFLNFPQWLRVLYLAATSVTPRKISSGNDNSVHDEDTSRLILSRMTMTMMESWLTRWILILAQQILSGLRLVPARTTANKTLH